MSDACDRAGTATERRHFGYRGRDCYDKVSPALWLKLPPVVVVVVTHNRERYPGQDAEIRTGR
jgi:hypothetical protein